MSTLPRDSLNMMTLVPVLGPLEAQFTHLYHTIEVDASLLTAVHTHPAR